MNRKAAAATASCVFAFIGFLIASFIWGINVLICLVLAATVIAALFAITGLIIAIYAEFCKVFKQ